MEWIPGRREVAFYAPAGTVSSLAKPTLPIRAKPSVALQSSERIARRVYRNVSKAIRLDLACARVFDDGFMGHMNDLVSRYINRVTLELSSGHPPEWLTKAGIHSPQLAIEWLFSKSVSELSKRAVRLLHPGEIICEDLYSRMLTGESGLLRHRFLKPLVSHFDAVDVERRISTDAIITYLMDLEAYENQGSYSEWQLLDAKSPLPVFRPTVFGSK
jgi:hypothetical protein